VRQFLFAALAASLLLASCAPKSTQQPGFAAPGTPLKRAGDEIMVAGQMFHTGAPVVLWTDPGGYDAYRTEKRFVPWERASWVPPAVWGPPDPVSGPPTPNRYNIRFAGSIGQPGCPLTSDDFERIRGGGWDLPTLQRTVDQFVIHYDVCGTSRQCFRVLHDARGLSVHFMLDIDGTIYQTLDLKERAWHATTSNDRSIGIEIANIGAYAATERDPLPRWYEPDPPGWDDLRGVQAANEHRSEKVQPPLITLPAEIGDGGVRTPKFVGHPARPYPVIGAVQGRELRQYDFTPQQYESLIKLTAALCAVFPNLPCQCPRETDGRVVDHRLGDDQLANYRGLLGHYHIQKDKADPGPAFQWDTVVQGAQRKLGCPSPNASPPAPRQPGGP
jgi:N-acetyl-anhydromuramyl-L-alanine amidase AmpD